MHFGKFATIHPRQMIVPLPTESRHILQGSSLIRRGFVELRARLNGHAAVRARLSGRCRANMSTRWPLLATSHDRLAIMLASFDISYPSLNAPQQSRCSRDPMAWMMIVTTFLARRPASTPLETTSKFQSQSIIRRHYRRQ